MSGRSLILRTSVSAILPLAALFSLYLLLAGHNAPGGGFVGGLVAGASLVLLHVDRGHDAVSRRIRWTPEVYVGIGIAVAAATGVAGFVWGEAFLQSEYWEWDIEVLGTVKVSTALAFDVGVYLVVIGAVAAVLEGLGQEEPA